MTIITKPLQTYPSNKCNKICFLISTGALPSVIAPRLRKLSPAIFHGHIRKTDITALISLTVAWFFRRQKHAQLLNTLWTQDVNWACHRRSEDVACVEVIKKRLQHWGYLLNVLCTFNSCPVSRRYLCWIERQTMKTCSKAPLWYLEQYVLFQIYSFETQCCIQMYFVTVWTV